MTDQERRLSAERGEIGRRGRRWAGRALAACLLAGILSLPVACAEEEGNAQEAAVIPSDRSVADQRADKARVKGAEDATLRIVEISDFQCPFCAQYYRETYPAVDSLYVKTGKVSYVWISFPNPQHPLAWPAIEASFCAGAVGKFWSMHDILFSRQAEWTASANPEATFVGYAAELGIDRASFEDCVRNDRVAPLQVRDYQNVVRAGINSTPYFILADSVAIRGAVDLASFRTALDTLLALKSAAKP
ncbi:MAG: DsbA family protein [Gemmatimonadota bacterium]